MKEENRKCWSCGKYKVFYTRGYAYFDKCEIGMCTEHKKIVEKCGTCDKWRYEQMHRNIRKSIALKHLSELLERLTAIEQIMREEYELDKIKYELDKSLR